MALETPEVVDTLDALDLLDIDEPGPWPGDPDGYTAWPIDWASAKNSPSSGSPPPGQDDAVSTVSGAPEDPWEWVTDELRQGSRGGNYLPPPDVLDALAWYLPIHNFGYGWGIYIHEDAILTLAGSILSFVDERRRENRAVVQSAVRMGLTVLYLHEAFHHKAESFAIRLEVTDHQRRYQPYFRNVYGPLLDQKSDELLEETLACAEMVRHLSEPTYKDDVAPDVWSATQIMLRGWIPTLPASYREGWSVVDDDAFADGRNRLSSQLDEGRVSPRRRHSEWNLAPHGYRGLFNCESVAHVLVPVGAQPLVPWFGGALALPSMSSEDVVKVVQGQGFGIVPRGGKGSHIKLRAAGKPMIIIPANREAVSPAVLRSVATALGVGSIRDLMDLPR